MKDYEELRLFYDYRKSSLIMELDFEELKEFNLKDILMLQTYFQDNEHSDDMLETASNCQKLIATLESIISEVNEIKEKCLNEVNSRKVTD